jgi:hypothetical protein
MWYELWSLHTDGKETQRIPEGIRIAGDPLSQDVQYPLEYSDLRLVWELPRKYRKKWEEMAKEPLLGHQRHPSGKWRYLNSPTVLTTGWSSIS